MSKTIPGAQTYQVPNQVPQRNISPDVEIETPIQSQDTPYDSGAEFVNKEQEASLNQMKILQAEEAKEKSEIEQEYNIQYADISPEELQAMRNDMDSLNDKIAEFYGDEYSTYMNTDVNGNEIDSSQLDNTSYFTKMGNWLDEHNQNSYIEADGQPQAQPESQNDIEYSQKLMDEYNQYRDLYYDYFYANDPESYANDFASDVGEATVSDASNLVVNSAIADAGAPKAPEVEETPADDQQQQTEIDMQLSNDDAGALQASQPEPQSNLEANSSVQALMEKYEADNAAYEQRNAGYEEEMMTPKFMKNYT